MTEFRGGNDMNKRTYLGIAVASLMLIYCSKDHSADYALLLEKGAVNLSVSLGKTGAIGKKETICNMSEKSSLYISMSSKEHGCIFDTVPLAGGSEDIVIRKTYSNMAAWTENEAVQWTLLVESRDKLGKILHSKDTTFTLEPEDTVNIPLLLEARYLVMSAYFYPIRDSVTRCEIIIDNLTDEKGDVSFQKQSLIGDTVEISNRYLSASPSGIPHTVSLNVYGVINGTEVLLYKGDTTITAKSGDDRNYRVNLKYAGENALLAATSMNAIIGNLKKGSGTTTEPVTIPEGLLLWNKLGSKYEVEHSETGPNGFFDNKEGELTFEPFYHGWGVRYPYLGPGKNRCKIAFDFSKSNFTTEQGCIEFWWKAGYTDNTNTSYAGFRAFFQTADTIIHPPCPMQTSTSGFLYMFNNNFYPDGVEDMSFYIGTADTSKVKRAATSATYHAFTENEVIHWACTYNVNGINNSDTTAIIFRNGVPIAATKEKWLVGKVRAFWLGANSFTVWLQSVRELAYGPANGVYDNLKIWNYAKTDFSDRFSE